MIPVPNPFRYFDSPAQSISTNDWNQAANLLVDQYGLPPFGTLAGTNPDASSLRNWGHVDRARWLGFHQIGNRRTHDCYALLTEIFEARPPVPAINGEPYYDGMENVDGGTETSALYCRSAMYGSVLSGALGGHIYGAGGWKGGIWSGEVEAASESPMWQGFLWPSADQMRHLKKFVLSEGRRYQDLVPAAGLLDPNQSGQPKSLLGWAYGARTVAQDLFLLYFEQEYPTAILSGAKPGAQYRLRWFNPRRGEWLEESVRSADAFGKIAMPPFPGGGARAANDWGLKLTKI